VAAGHSVTVNPDCWQELFDQVMGRVAGRFARVELRRRAKAFVRGLLSDLPRKNCWTIAEHAGDTTPDGMQHLLARAVWDADAVRDDVRALLVEHLGDRAAVLIIDETGTSRRPATPPGSSVSTPAPPARSTTPRSPST
jgi:SRSO17 transposase